MKLMVTFSILGNDRMYAGQGEVADRDAWDAEAAEAPEQQDAVEVVGVIWATSPAPEADLAGGSYMVFPHECKEPIEIPTRDQPPLFLDAVPATIAADGETA